MDLRSAFVECVCLSWKWLKKHRYLWSDYYIYIIQSYMHMSCKWCINTINALGLGWWSPNAGLSWDATSPHIFTLGSVCLRLNIGSGPLHQQWNVKVYKKLTTKKVMSSWWWHWFWGEPQLYNEDSPRKKILCLPSWRPCATSSIRCRRVRWPVKRHLFMRPAFPCAGWACKKDVAGTASPELFVIYSGIINMYIKFCLTPAFWGECTVHQIDFEEHRE